MNIRVITHNKLNKIIKKLISKIKGIICLLVNSQIDDFMFIWDIWDINDKYEEDKKINKEMLLKDIKSSEYSIWCNVSNSRIIVSNENCKINGYYEGNPIDFDVKSI